MLGVAGDEMSALPVELGSRVKHRGTVQTISPNDGESLAAQLSELGLLELSEKAWLHLPAIESAGDYVKFWQAKAIGAMSDGSHRRTARNRWSPGCGIIPATVEVAPTLRHDRLLRGAPSSTFRRRHLVLYGNGKWLSRADHGYQSGGKFGTAL